MTSSDVRDELLHALRIDLVGPAAADEALRGIDPPSRFYLTGFLVPADAPLEERRDADADETVAGNEAGSDEETEEDETPREPSFFPSSIGVSVLLQPGAGPLTVTARWGDYAQAAGGDPDHPEWQVWQRVAREIRLTVPVELDGTLKEHTSSEPGAAGVQIKLLARAVAQAAALGLPAGTRSVHVFLVNARTAADGSNTEARMLFQPELELSAVDGFEPRPDRHSEEALDTDDRIADLQYRDVAEWAVGHGIATTVVRGEDGTARAVRTCWLPWADVARTEVGQPSGASPDEVEAKAASLRMDVLAGLQNGAEAREKLAWIANDYADFLKMEGLLATAPSDARSRSGRLTGERRKVVLELLDRGERARRRIEAGIALLGRDPVVLDAFVRMNAAMAASARRRDPRAPAWRLFQIAFVLLNLDGLSGSEHKDRSIVDLLFFPTGGGKTEAYLGLAAYAMLHRRLSAPAKAKIAAAGLTVLMRYTLRLLTLDQLGRAATLVCALELERQRDPDGLGAWPFEIGLWVGKKATPNEMTKPKDRRRETAENWTKDYKDPSRRVPKPVPLEACPWCASAIGPNNFVLVNDAGKVTGTAPTNLHVLCLADEERCAFGGKALPILAVDSVIYRRLPAFLIATADKIAALPWRGPSGQLFGAVTHFDAGGFSTERGTPLPAPMPGPALIIQDELHLISGPLGTMAGLYEIAVDALSSRGAVRPKIVASTATVRRADAQIQGLFGRAAEVFPPFGIDRKSSWFAVTVDEASRAGKALGRRYVGIAAPGRSMKVVLLRAYLAVLGAAARAAERDLATADPYLTLLGYFNSLRELGGARRIVEDEVRSRAGRLEARRRDGEATGLLARRDINPDVLELTSRVTTAEVATAKAWLALAHPGTARPEAKLAKKATTAAGNKPAPRVDVALATNMISVGLDITRLGLMIVLGQPRTASEYIQATSRVGRDADRPGLVVTLLNVYRPRDRSHFERFEYFHETFYRAVEATSVTPFARRAIDRALPGVLTALVRHGVSEMTSGPGAGWIAAHRKAAEAATEALATRARAVAGAEADTHIRAVVADLLDSWTRLAASKQGAHGLVYWQYEPGLREHPPLLRTLFDLERSSIPEERKFKAQWSLRDVEPSCPVHIVDAPLGGTP